MTNLQRALVATAATLAIGSGAPADAQTEMPSSSIVGSWTLNKALSDLPEGRLEGRGERRGPGGGFGRGGGRGGGGRGGGGIGGGFPGGFGGGGSGRGNPEDAMRRQDALREVLEAPDRLTIIETGAMVIVTTGDGRTLRFSTDGTKVKDESTGIERRTTWQAGKLVSEITGSGPHMKEIYSADLGHRELLVVIQIEGSGRDEPARVLHRIYQAGAR